MKRITFLFCLLTASLGFSQVVLEDFEGAAPTLVFTNGPGSATIVADPLVGGTNGNVLEIITGAASAPWQQAELTMQGDYIALTATKTVSVDVYSDTAFDMLTRVSTGYDPVSGNPASDAATDASHPGGGWATLTFDFNDPKDGLPVADGNYGRIFFFNLWDSAAGGGAGGWVCGADNCSPVSTTYVDNISAIAGDPPPGPAEPTVAAPTPPARSPENVRSIFSDQYTDIAVDTYDTPWCGATTTEIMVAGNATQQITGLGCEGVEFVTGRFDASTFGFFHMDIWTDSDTMDKSFNFKFSDWQGGGGEVGALEYSATNANILPAVNPGTWISIDLPMSAFTVINGVDGSDLVQFVITSDLGTVYYDNLYLHNNDLSANEFATSNFKVYPNPTKNNWNIESNTTISAITVYDILGKQVASLTPNTNDVEISTANIKAGVYFARIDGINGSKTVKLIKE